jgi:hypothetical protein
VVASSARRNPAGVRAIAIALAAALPLHSVGAAETGGSDQASTHLESKSDSQPDAKAAVKGEAKSDNNAEQKSADKADDDKSEKESGEKDASKSGDKSEAKSDDLWQRKMLFGDLGGRRPELDKYGMKLGLLETSEVLGSPTGGLHQGAIYEGLTDLYLGVDFRPTLHIRGISLRAPIKSMGGD